MSQIGAGVQVLEIIAISIREVFTTVRTESGVVSPIWTRLHGSPRLLGRWRRARMRWKVQIVYFHNNVTKCYEMLLNITKYYEMLRNVTKCYEIRIS